MSAAHDMIFNVYGDDDALWTVRLQSGFNVDGTRSGYSEPKSRITTAVTTVAVHAKTHPSPPRLHTIITAEICATAAMPSASHVQSLPYETSVQSPKTATTTVTGTPRRLANRTASSRTTPS